MTGGRPTITKVARSQVVKNGCGNRKKKLTTEKLRLSVCSFHTQRTLKCNTANTINGHSKQQLPAACTCPSPEKKPMPLMFRKVPSRWRWSIKIITFIGHITMRSFLYQRMGYVDILFKSFNGSSAQQVQGSNMWLWCAVGTLPSQSTCESIHRTVRKGLSQSASAVLHE